MLREMPIRHCLSHDLSNRYYANMGTTIVINTTVTRKHILNYTYRVIHTWRPGPISVKWETQMKI